MTSGSGGREPGHHRRLVRSSTRRRLADARFARNALLPELPADLSGARVVGLGCGERIVTRAVAARGAIAKGVDPTKRLIERARSIEMATPSGATYAIDDGTTLATIGRIVVGQRPDLAAAIRSVVVC